MDLNTLVQVLRRQAKAGSTVVFDGDFLADDQIQALRAGFGLAANACLTINGISETEIPDPANQQVILQAGTVDVLNQKQLSLEVIFTLSTTQTLEFIVSVSLPPQWQFKDSFEDLTEFPFDKVEPSSSLAIYDTQATQAFYPWADRPAASVALVPGLNLATWMKLNIFSGAVTLLQQVLNDTDKYKFSGPIVLGGTPYPVMNIVTLLLDKTFKITDNLVIGDLALALRVTEPKNDVQDLSLRLQASTNDLNFGVQILDTNNVLSFFAEPIAGHTFGINQILALPGGSGFQHYIPDELKKAFDAATLQSFLLTQSAAQDIGVTSFVIGSNQGYELTLIENVLILKNVRLDFETVQPGTSSSFTTVSFSATAGILPQVFKGDFVIALNLERAPTQGWQISQISGNYLGQLVLSDVVQGIVGNTVLLPEDLKRFSFSDFGAAATKQDGKYTYTIYGSASASLPIKDTLLTATLNVVARYSSEGYSVSLTGFFLVGQQGFALELDLGKSQSKPDKPTIVMTAKWAAENKDNYLQFEDIARAFGFSADQIPTIPKDLNLGLKQADFYYDYTNRQLLLGLVSDTYGSADFVAVRNPTTSSWQFFFGLNIDKPIPISNLPLIGDILPKADTVEIKKIRVVIASAAFDDALATAANDIITNKLGGAYPPVPDSDQKGMPKGLGFSMAVAVGTFEIPIMFGAGQSSRPVLDAGALESEELLNGRAMILAVPAPQAPVSTNSSSDGVLWFNLQKTFGPVSIQKIGMQYKDEKIWVLVNMSLTGAGLTIGLIGFGIGSKISNFTPSFTIQGIDITYAGGGVQISGGLRGSIEPVVDFVGELMVNAQSFGIAGLAGYTSVQGSPSMFLYAVLNAPLGGPAFFFVTGIAAGFGFNRNLQIPDVGGVAAFPLVQWAQGQGKPPGMNFSGDIGDQVNGVLQRLSSDGIVAPQVGQYWLAAGVKFTSFELATSFALAVIKFGSQFEVDILGTTRICIPPVAPVIYAELQLLASFRPDEGFIGISGQLTAQSYVLSPDCHLTGGFAYYLWFSGPLAGNFVTTMGGYSPHFNVPSYYPKVPRLGINWKVSDRLIVKGDAYFALTSAAVMAGGGFSATWTAGGISAWFNVQADFLMVYRPFHYFISASVDIGASFRISLIFTHITITIHVGASLEIWGPEFTGKATIDLDIISFTIYFGSSNKDRQTTIPWKDFATQMLPGQGGAQSPAPPPRTRRARRALAGVKVTDAPPKDTSGIHINASKGVVKTLSDDPGKLNFVLNPEAMEITIATTIPIKESHATFTGLVKLAPEKDQPLDPHENLIQPNEDFGVGPVGTPSSAFVPRLTISIVLKNPPLAAEADGPLITLQCVRSFINAPNSLWQKITFDGNGNPQLDDPLSNATIQNVVGGYKVVPVPLAPAHTLPINIEYLKYTVSPNVQHFEWSTAYVPTTDSFSDDLTVEDTIVSQTAESNRSKLLPAIHQYINSIATAVDLQMMNDATHAGLLAEPAMRLLGEEKAAA